MSDLIAALVAFSIISNPTAAGYWWHQVTPRPKERQALLATGLIFVLGLICIMAAEPLLELLRISPGTWRITTGALMIAGILWAVLRRRPFTPATLEGEQPTWLLPARLAVWIYQPALIATVISITVDEGPRRALLAVAFGTMLLFQMLVRASYLPYRLRPSTWREVSRVTALVGLIVAVQFILAGVYTA